MNLELLQTRDARYVELRLSITECEAIRAALSIPIIQRLWDKDLAAKCLDLTKFFTEVIDEVN